MITILPRITLVIKLTILSHIDWNGFVIADNAFLIPSNGFDSNSDSLWPLLLFSASVLCLVACSLSKLLILVKVSNIESRMLLILINGSTWEGLSGVISLTLTGSTLGVLKSFSVVIFPDGGAFTIALVFGGVYSPPPDFEGGGGEDTFVFFSLRVTLLLRSFILHTLLSSSSKRVCSSNGSSFPTNLWEAIFFLRILK